MRAEDRRVSIIEAATTVFARHGFGSATTAMLAQAADINEALVYRHFATKGVLYEACIDAAWQAVRQRCETAIAAEPDVAHQWSAMGSAFLEMARLEPGPTQLWARSLFAPTGDAALDSHLASVMRDVLDYVTAVVAHSQAAGGIPPDRQPRAEAWLLVAVALLGIAAPRLGDLVDNDLEDVLTAHRRWLTGATANHM